MYSIQVAHHLASKLTAVLKWGKASRLLIKQHDAYAQQGYNANAYDYSAVSNRSLAEIAAQSSEASKKEKEDHEQAL